MVVVWPRSRTIENRVLAELCLAEQRDPAELCPAKPLILLN
jgi:hypothetical protein